MPTGVGSFWILGRPNPPHLGQRSNFEGILYKFIHLHDGLPRMTYGWTPRYILEKNCRRWRTNNRPTVLASIGHAYSHSSCSASRVFSEYPQAAPNAWSRSVAVVDVTFSAWRFKTPIRPPPKKNGGFGDLTVLTLIHDLYFQLSASFDREPYACRSKVKRFRSSSGSGQTDELSVYRSG